jgi:membrane protein implicated in regulation of membrane protease activity
MFTLYLASLVLGGILLGSSLVLGGHGDGDVSGGDLEHDPGHPEVGASAADFVIGAFRSLRFWTFFFAFAGGTGIALTLLGLPSVVTAVAAAVMGATSGGFAAWAFRYLGRNNVSSSLSSEDWIGRTAKVVVPVSDTRPGKVLLSFDNEVKELVAMSAGASDGAIGIGEEVIVVSMHDGVARVTLNRPDAQKNPAAQTHGRSYASARTSRSSARAAAAS